MGVWCFFSVYLYQHVHLCWTRSLFPKRKSCMFVIEVLLLCVLFFHFGVFAVPLRGETDMWFTGQRWMYHSRVLSDLLWTGVHYNELTSRSLWKGMPLVRWLYVLQEVMQQRWSNLGLGRFPVRLINTIKSLKHEGNSRCCDFQIWKSLLSNNI